MPQKCMRLQLMELTSRRFAQYAAYALTSPSVSTTTSFSSPFCIAAMFSGPDRFGFGGSSGGGDESDATRPLGDAS